MVENLIYIGLTLVLVVASFLFGLNLSDKYHTKAEQDKKYALEKQYARLMAGCDADDPVQPYVAHPDNRFSVPSEFIDRLETNKSATLQIDKTKAI